jgi:outer membrane protein assembly factor BamB
MSRAATNRIGPWWIPAALVLICAAALGWIWWGADNERQTNVLLTISFVGGTGILLVLWMLLLSGFSLRSRLAVSGMVAGVCALVACLTRIEGVTGDIVPILTWRFAPKADETLRREIPASPPVEASPVESSFFHEYPQILGHLRDGTVRGVTLARDWEKQAPTEIWRREIGAAWSGFAVAGDAAFTQEQRGESEMVTCYDLRTGEIRWAHSDTARYETTLGGVGPRATPTVADARVFTLGATGILNCLERATGARVWTRNIVEENGARVKEWGMSGSPLLHRDLVVVSAGGLVDRSLVA